MKKLAMAALLLVGCGGDEPAGLDGTWDSGTRWLRLAGADYQRADDRGTFTAAGDTIVFSSVCGDHTVERVHFDLEGAVLHLGGVAYRRIEPGVIRATVCR